MPRKEEETIAIKLDVYIYIYVHDCYPVKLTRIWYFGGRSIRGSLDCPI